MKILRTMSSVLLLSLLTNFNILSAEEAKQANRRDTVLIEAAQKYDHKFVKALSVGYFSKEAIDVNAQDEEFGRTALIWGAVRPKIVEALLERTEIDINMKDDEGETALMHASRSSFGDSYRAVEMLLERPEIDVNARNNKGKTALLQFFEGDVFGFRNDNSKIKTVKALLQHPEIDVNAQDNVSLTALMGAIHVRNVQILRILLGRPEIDVNAQNSLGTALIYASRVDYVPELAEALLEHPEIDVNVQDFFGQTALMHASSGIVHGAKVAKMLLDERFKTDVNIKDNDGRTALMHAVFDKYELNIASEKGRIHAVKALLKHPEIDVNVTDNDGKTAFNLAGSRKIQKLLRDFQKKKQK